jgi:polyferredoxin
MLTSLIDRSDFGISVLHDRNPLFVVNSNGSIRNAYTLRIMNKVDSEERPVRRHRGREMAHPVGRRFAAALRTWRSSTDFRQTIEWKACSVQASVRLARLWASPRLPLGYLIKGDFRCA